MRNKLFIGALLIIFAIGFVFIQIKPPVSSHSNSQNQKPWRLNKASPNLGTIPDLSSDATIESSPDTSEDDSMKNLTSEEMAILESEKKDEKVAAQKSLEDFKKRKERFLNHSQVLLINQKRIENHASAPIKNETKKNE